MDHFREFNWLKNNHQHFPIFDFYQMGHFRQANPRTDIILFFLL